MKNWKSILLLVLVFLAGMVAGTAATRAFTQQVAQHASTQPEWAQSIIERSLARQLHLDAGQQAQLHTIMDNARSQILALRGEYRPKIESIYQQTDAQIQSLLQPSQLQRYDKIREKEHPMIRSLRLTP